MTETFTHQPVLLNEVIENLITDKNGIYIDCTFGRGGHSTQLLKHLGKNAFLLAIDKDPEAIKASVTLQADPRFHIEQGSFINLKTLAEKYSLIGKVTGVLLDLGVSSPQLDDPKRGFSFLKEGTLDMRMDPTRGMDAATWVNNASEDEIAFVLKEYGEERFAKRIAKAIVQARLQQNITSTTELAEIIAKANPKWERHKNPATRSFQAIRIYINKELEELKLVLDQSLDILQKGGRLAVISFHSLEDRIVKQFIRLHEKGNNFPKYLPIQESMLEKKLKKLGKSIQPTQTEIENNARARSAKLRIAEKLV